MPPIISLCVDLSFVGLFYSCLSLVRQFVADFIEGDLLL
jgi:hypothetical protein